MNKIKQKDDNIYAAKLGDTKKLTNLCPKISPDRQTEQTCVANSW